MEELRWRNETCRGVRNHECWRPRLPVQVAVSSQFLASPRWFVGLFPRYSALRLRARHVHVDPDGSVPVRFGTLDGKCDVL